MNDQERRAEKVEARDRALRAIRQADAFLVITLNDDTGADSFIISRSKLDVQEFARCASELNAEIQRKWS